MIFRVFFPFLVTFSFSIAANAQQIHIANPKVALPQHTFQDDSTVRGGGYRCNGKTANIDLKEKRTIAFICYYTFEGGVNFGDGTSGMGKVGLVVSASNDPSDPKAPFSMSTIWFDVSELKSGNLTKIVKVGGLYLQVYVKQHLLRGDKIDMEKIAFNVFASTTPIKRPQIITRLSPQLLLQMLRPNASAPRPTNPNQSQAMTTDEARQIIAGIVSENQRRRECSRCNGNCPACDEEKVNDFIAMDLLAIWYGDNCDPTCGNDCTTLYGNLDTFQRADFSPPCE